MNEPELGETGEGRAGTEKEKEKEETENNNIDVNSAEINENGNKEPAVIRDNEKKSFTVKEEKTGEKTTSDKAGQHGDGRALSYSHTAVVASVIAILIAASTLFVYLSKDDATELINAKMGIIDSKFTDINSRISSISNTLGNIDKRLGSAESLISTDMESRAHAELKKVLINLREVSRLADANTKSKIIEADTILKAILSGKSVTIETLPDEDMIKSE